MNVNKSLYFHDDNHNEYFLFQVLNYGKTTDELKFVFNSIRSGTAIVYTPSGVSQPSKEDIIIPYAEISYHNDGIMLGKLPKYKNGDSNDYFNPFGKGIKRIPLNQIGEFVPIIKYTVVNYRLCKKSTSTDAIMLPFNKNIFNGEPFECVIWLGNMAYADPPNYKADEMIYRINDIAHNIDLIVWIYKSDYRGEIIPLPNTSLNVFNTGNIIQAVEKKPA